MTGFSTDWLAQREPFDTAARALAWPSFGPLLETIRPTATAGASTPLRVLDLACGSGANLRALAPRLGGAQAWQLVDHDPALLAALPHAMASWAHAAGYRIDNCHNAGAALRVDGPDFSVELVTERADLGSGLDTLTIGQPHLITASALLDLVSARWIESLVQQAGRAGAAVLFALTVDGRTGWNPPDEADAEVQRLFASNQRRDKGFGPALGPTAGAFVARCLEAAGYAVVQSETDWEIDATGGAPTAPAMLAAMLEGMASAAIDQQPDALDIVRAWQARRLALIGRTQLRVGHRDLMAAPAQRPDPDPTTGRRPSQTP